LFCFVLTLHQRDCSVEWDTGTVEILGQIWMKFGGVDEFLDSDFFDEKRSWSVHFL